MAIVIGYLLGSVPFAYIAARLVKGVDIRQVGGGNNGALNVIREIGLAPGLSVLIADMGKGILAIYVARWLGLAEIWILVAGFAAIAGHNWTVFLKFRGGKGGATTLGVLLALMPVAAGISFAILLIISVITSNIRLAIAVFMACLPVIVWQMNGTIMLIVYTLLLGLFLTVMSFTGPEKPPVAGQKKGLVFDREYHFWQSKKKL